MNRYFFYCQKISALKIFQSQILFHAKPSCPLWMVGNSTLSLSICVDTRRLLKSAALLLTRSDSFRIAREEKIKWK